MIGYLTSFATMFDRRGSAPEVRRIEIPLIQRDFAQGRTSGSVNRIRNEFLDALHHAVVTDTPINLDFVYGDVDDTTHTLHPLDGQQRLTTLFLLHWYLASRTGRDPGMQTWSAFSYATRPTARLFCKRLVSNPPPADVDSPSEWITDQEWYLHVWEHDPSIRSMLTVIDAIHDRFANEDLEMAWQCLADPDRPAISFYLLPIQDMGSGEDLYITMNSRGKPLTDFENFKARFEKTLSELDLKRAKEFAHKVDGGWSDLLWPIHGGDFLVDDEFMRYVEFVVEICEWREGRTESGPLEPRTRSLFAPDNTRADEHLDFLFEAFDAWRDIDHVRSTFAKLFATVEDQSSHPFGAVLLFGSDVETNLFEACCRTFGDLRGKARVFSYGQSLLLHAVLLHLTKGTEDISRRLRILRNLLSASSENEVRREVMPRLLQEVEELVLHGTLSSASAFNRIHVDDEKRKAGFLLAHPDLTEALFALEDHPILRGSLIAFDLDAHNLEPRAAAFDSIFSDPANWSAATGALLAVGEYQRRLPKSDSFQFGTRSPSNERVWRDLFTATGREGIATLRTTLGNLLDAVATEGGSTRPYLESLAAGWLKRASGAQVFDWRYYLVRYEWMRQGESGLYIGAGGAMGYSLVMLRKTQLNSLYRDAFLYGIWCESGVGTAVDDPWFTGYTHEERWMVLTQSGTRLRNSEAGFVLKPPTGSKHRAQFESVLRARDDARTDGENWFAQVQQADRGGALVDVEDRVHKGAELLQALVAAGL